MASISISVSREKQAFLLDAAIEVFLDGIKQGSLKSAECIAFEAEEGEHRLDFKCGIRSAVISADFYQSVAVILRFNRGSGEIETSMNGAAEKQLVYDWETQPRDDNMVYPDKLKTSPTVSALLSILLVGLGQMVNGQLIKGLLMLIVALVIGAITGGVAAVVVWIISAIDAYMSANKLKQGKPIPRFSFF